VNFMAAVNSANVVNKILFLYLRCFHIPHTDDTLNFTPERMLIV
jgi:hypothetical protein